MLSKECKNTIRSHGNIQLFELGEVFYENTVRIVWTGVLFETLQAFGATVLWDSCCSFSTQDHVPAGFVKAGLTQFFFVFWKSCSFHCRNTWSLDFSELLFPCQELRRSTFSTL